MKRSARPTTTFAERLLEIGWPGAETLDDATVLRLRDAWRRRYDGGLTDDSRGGYEWHAFGVGSTPPCVDGDLALTAYATQTGPVVVITAETRLPLEGARLAAPPPMPPMRVGKPTSTDLLVFHESLAWTFAVTHDWVGLAPISRRVYHCRPKRRRLVGASGTLSA